MKISIGCIEKLKKKFFDEKVNVMTVNEKSAFPGVKLHLENDRNISYKFSKISLCKTLYSRLLFEQRSNLAIEMIEYYEKKYETEKEKKGPKCNRFIVHLAKNLLNALFSSKQPSKELFEKTVHFTQLAAEFYSSGDKKHKAASFWEQGLKIFKLPRSSLDIKNSEKVKRYFEHQCTSFSKFKRISISADVF